MKKFMSIMLAAAIATGGTAMLGGSAVKAQAEESNVLQAVAHYEFNNAESICKDSSLNGFDLVAKDTSAPADEKKGIEWGEEEGKTFVKLRRTYEEDGANQRGGMLYAPGLSGSQDFTDFINGSFTISIQFRGVDIPQANGSYYILSTGRYNNSVTITPWDDKIEYQPYSQLGAPVEDLTTDEAYNWTQSKKGNISATTNNTWNTVTICGDAEANEVKVYHNGVLQNTHSDAEAKIFLSGGSLNRYTFALGGQCENDGGANTMYGSADVADVRVYDTALSAENVAKIYNGEEAVIESGMAYAESIQSIQTQLDAIDTLITDRNKLSNILKALPNSVKVTLNDGSVKKTNLVWFKANESEIKCYLQSRGYVNAKQLSLKLDYGYTVKFTYNSELISVTDVKLNGVDFVPGTKTTKLPNTSLTFKITKLDPKVNISGFYFDDLDFAYEDLWDEEEQYFYIDVYDGADIEIFAELNKGTVTYYDGETSLGTTEYTEGGNETLMQAPEKEGYTFAGWYTDKEFKNKFTSLDYSNPQDLTLYAKYNKKSAGKKSGCGGSLGAELSLFGIITLASAVAFVANKKKN